MNSWRRPRDLGEIVRGAWVLYTHNFTVLFLIALITAPLQLLSVIIVRTVNEDVAASVSSLLLVPQLGVTMVAVAAVIHAVHAITGGTPAEPGASLDAGLGRFGALLNTALLAAGLMLLSLLAFPFLLLVWARRPDARIDGRRDWYFVLPFVLTAYLAIRWAFYAQRVMTEDERSWAALDASADAVRNNWWRVLGIIAVLLLLQGGPLILSMASSLAPPLVEGTVTALIGALILPFAACGQTLLYYDLKARKFIDLNPPPIAPAESDVPGESPRDI